MKILRESRPILVFCGFAPIGNRTHKKKHHNTLDGSEIPNKTPGNILSTLFLGDFNYQPFPQLVSWSSGSWQGGPSEVIYQRTPKYPISQRPKHPGAFFSGSFARNHWRVQWMILEEISCNIMWTSICVANNLSIFWGIITQKKGFETKNENEKGLPTQKSRSTWILKTFQQPSTGGCRSYPPENSELGNPWIFRFHQFHPLIFGDVSHMYLQRLLLEFYTKQPRCSLPEAWLKEYPLEVGAF